MAGVVTDIIDRTQSMMGRRFPWERTWEQCARFTLPMVETGGHENRIGESSGSSYSSRAQDWALGPLSEIHNKEVYDTTALWGLERMATGMESLITPANDKWHGLTLDERFGYKPTDIEADWFELQRDYLFTTRYDPRSGFALANQSAIRSCCALGTGVVFVEEAFGKGRADASILPMFYRPIPLLECYLANDPQGETNTNHRDFRLSAKQAVKLFDGVGSCSAKTIEKANDPKRCDDLVRLIHAVCPREEKGSYANGMRDADFASFYVEPDEKHMIGDGGFYEFPYAVYHWSKRAEVPYGESPVMLALAEIKSLNLLAKNALKAAQQHVRPPVATMDDATMNRPNLNPGAINYGGVDKLGNSKIKPIMLQTRYDFVQAILEASRMQVREALYVNLWQILIQNAKMTATEVMQRAAEKGELLGPVGQRIQAALAKLTMRDLAIIERKGAWFPGSPLAPPSSLADKDIALKFSSPLDRLRRMPELLGTQMTLEVAAQVQPFDEGVSDRLDGDEILRTSQEVTGAPRRILRSDEATDDIRTRRQQALAAAQTAETAKTGADALSKGLPAVRQIQDQIATLDQAA